jgi:hypothetical protein
MRKVAYHPLALTFSICLWNAKDNLHSGVAGVMDEQDIFILLSEFGLRYDWTDDKQADLYARITEAVQTLDPCTFIGMQDAITTCLVRNERLYG